MTSGWRSTALFTAGSLAGALVVLGAYLRWFEPAPGSVPVRSEPVAAFPDAAPPAPVRQVAAVDTCPSQPLAAAATEDDGKFGLHLVMNSPGQAEPSAFVAVAREAAGEGRQRDAEIAYIAACRMAAQASGAQSAPVADVKSLMAQHYVLLAAREPADATRDGLLQRASALFAESAGAYSAALGHNASKTRLAEQRLASVPEPSTLRAAVEEEPQRTDVMGAARETAPERPRRGSPTLLVQSDPELAQLEGDLQRLRAQAARVSRDPRGLQQRDAYAVAQRDARCQDKACLRRWYAQRRAQLLDEF